MKAKYFLLALLSYLYSIESSHAQDEPLLTYQSVKVIASEHNVYAEYIEASSSGGYYTYGEFSGSASFPSSGLGESIEAIGNPDVFLARYDGQGTLMWVFNLGRIALIDGMNTGGMAVDANNNVYICGAFSGTNVNFNPLGSPNFLSATGGKDAFIAKYSEAGILLWIKSFSTTAFETCTALALGSDGDGKLYAALRFSEDVTINQDGDPVELTSEGGSDAVLMAFDLDGTYQWHYQIGTLGNDEITAVAVSTSNEVAFGANINGVSNPIPQSELLLKKLSASGNELWSINYNNIGEGNRFSRLLFDDNDMLYTCGEIQALTDFDPDPEAQAEVSPLFKDPFVAAYNHQNASLQWVQSLRSSGLQDFAASIARAGNVVYLVGSFDFEALFEGQVPAFSSAGGTDLFVAAYNYADGSFVGAERFGGDGSERVRDALFQNADGLTMVGDFSTSLQFDAQGDPIDSQGSRDGFIADFNYAWNLSSSFRNNLSGIKIYPVPSSDVIFVEGLGEGARSYRMTSIDGKLVQQGAIGQLHQRIELDLNNLPAGMYILSIEQAAGSAVSRIIKQ